MKKEQTNLANSKTTTKEFNFLNILSVEEFSFTSLCDLIKIIGLERTNYDDDER